MRQNVDTTVTWSCYEKKGDVKLVSWTKQRVDSSISSVQLASKHSVTSLLPIDETGEGVIVNHDNSRLECYKNGEPDKLWTWDVPNKPTYLRTFKASECPLTQKSEGWVLLVVSEQPQFYSISSASQPNELSSATLPHVPNVGE